MIGLAAGFVKDMTTCNTLLSLGFDSVELGTFTINPRPGNNHPRLFTNYPTLKNKMGFPNPGIHRFLEDIQENPPIGKIGVSISGFDAPKIINLIDGLPIEYIAINVSSPNAPGIMSLSLKELMSFRQKKQIFFKINPEQIEESIESGADGLILCNTLNGESGPHLLNRTITAIISARKLSKSIYIIGCGGVWSRNDANKLLCVGANAVQLLTSWLYSGIKQY